MRFSTDDLPSDWKSEIPDLESEGSFRGGVQINLAGMNPVSPFSFHFKICSSVICSGLVEHCQGCQLYVLCQEVLWRFQHGDGILDQHAVRQRQSSQAAHERDRQGQQEGQRYLSFSESRTRPIHFIVRCHHAAADFDLAIVFESTHPAAEQAHLEAMAAIDAAKTAQTAQTSAPIAVVQVGIAAEEVQEHEERIRNMGTIEVDEDSEDEEQRIEASAAAAKARSLARAAAGDSQPSEDPVSPTMAAAEAPKKGFFSTLFQ
jgi:hypothetical protein